MQEVLAPVSIIHGYGGYNTESGIRNSFLDILQEKGEVTGDGLGVPSLPTLVTTNGFSIIKGNGIPFIAINEERKWAVLLSLKRNAARIMLEVIWSKISLYFDVKMPWGDDSNLEVPIPLIFAIPTETEDAAGWMYEPVRIKESELNSRKDFQLWEPVKIDPVISSVIYVMLGYGGYIHLNDISEIAANYSIPEDTLLKKFMNTLLFKQVGDYIRPISSILHMVSDSGNQEYISSSTEQLGIWCDSHNVCKSYINLIVID